MRVSNTLTSHGRGGRRRTALALTSALAVTAGATLVLGQPGRAAADPIEDCTATTGAIVAVDSGHWDGGAVRGCDAHPATGTNPLHNAGSTTTGTRHDGPASVCRLGSSTFGNGAQYPTPAEEPCADAPQAVARQNADAGFAPDEWTHDSDPVATEQAIPGPATPSPRPGRTPDLAKGGAYLTDPVRLLDGHYYEAFPDSGFADFGLTVDAAYALAATGTDDAALRRIVDFLDRQGKDGSERTVNDWTAVGTEYVGGGSVGKEALLAEIVGRDPRAFGGHDLIAALDQAVCDHADTDNGCAAQGNYLWATSVFSQSLGILAQLRADDTEHAAAPVAYLKGLQAADGSWPSLIPASGDSDVDSTAMAVMALALVPGEEAARAVDRGLAWLAAQQLPDGGFPGAAGDSTNSAALAAQGLTLRQSAYAERIARAVEFLAAEQNADGGFNVASTGQQGSDVRASTQALGGATGLSFGTLHRDLDGTAPTGSPSPSPSRSGPASPSESASASPSPSSLSPSPSPSSSTPERPSGSVPVSEVPSSGTGTGTGAGGLPVGTGVPAGGTGPDGLAFTGTDVLELAVPGLLFAAAGGAVLVATRRRNAPAAGRHR
ncbi:prenyltransferase/squalene oxidase repeat-containing protein [Kitasatospora sp. NPDC090308]|uniref:prenyltransferase/squalene oxidase repeat-containing protein n=1 Tax=Kitasatospora sp. NPDC090308 TaxID=3364082 RepID=UPI003804BDD9